MFNIFSTKRVWINKKLLFTYSNLDPIFSYYFPKSKHLKVYRPLTNNKKNKWIGNTCREDVQGIDNLDYTKDLIILTSSLKDAIVLHQLGYPSIALNSEGTHPTLDVISLINKFKYKYVLYDNDEAGLNYSKSLMEKIPALNLLEILDDKAKDPSDFVVEYSYEKLDQMLNSQHGLRQKVEKK